MQPLFWLEIARQVINILICTTSNVIVNHSRRHLMTTVEDTSCLEFYSQCCYLFNNQIKSTVYVSHNHNNKNITTIGNRIQFVKLRYQNSMCNLMKIYTKMSKIKFCEIILYHTRHQYKSTRCCPKNLPRVSPRK